MKMKQFIVIVFIAATLAMSACSSGPSGSDPKATLTGFIKALSKKDVKEARKYATADSKPVLDIMEMGLAMANTMKQTQPEADQKIFDETNMVIGDAKIDGDIATVPVTDKTKGETTNIVLKKEGGDWKVAFDPSTMAEMAGQKMKSEGQDVDIDSLRNELQKINSDSIKKQMEEGMKQLDSLSKAMKK